MPLLEIILKTFSGTLIGRKLHVYLHSFDLQ